MKRIYIFCLIVNVVKVFSKSETATWITPMMNNINSLRVQYGQPIVTYDFDLHDELIRIRDTTWPGYFYEYNKDFCMDFPYNRTNCNRAYSLFPKNNTCLLHDTILTPQRIVLIISQRLKQVQCMDINKCSNKTFSNWLSCAKDPSINYFYTSKKCIYFYHYVPKLLHRDLRSMACLILKYESGYSPIYQPFSFVCYSNLDWYYLDSDRLI